MTTPSARVARVVHVITLLELGGAQQATLHTVAALDRQRFDVVLVAGKGGLLDEEARALPRTRVHLLEALVHPVRPLADLRAFLRLRRLFRDLRREDDLPLLVHTHSGKAGVLGRAAARMARAEVIVHHVHGLSYPPMKKSLAAPLGRAAERMADRWTHGYVSVCRANLEEGRRLGLYRRGEQQVIRSGFDPGPFLDPGVDRAEARRRLGLEVDAHVAGMIACFKPQKNPLAFVRVAARVAAELGDARFLVVGDGRLRPDFEAEARRLGVADRILLLGWRRDVPALLRALDVLVLTSLWEGLPRVIPQAFLAGVPVVATAVDGVPEVVRPGENGFLVPPHDDGACADRVVEILRTRGRCLDPGPVPREFAEAFHQDRMVQDHEAFYLRLLDRVTPPPPLSRRR